jgi:hypothetical protein
VERRRSAPFGRSTSVAAKQTTTIAVIPKSVAGVLPTRVRIFVSFEQKAFCEQRLLGRDLGRIKVGARELLSARRV